MKERYVKFVLRATQYFFFAVGLLIIAGAYEQTTKTAAIGQFFMGAIIMLGSMIIFGVIIDYLEKNETNKTK